MSGAINAGAINSGAINAGEVAEIAAATLDAVSPFGSLVWLLELEVGGAVLRYATERVEVATAAGDVLVFSEGLADPQIGYGAVAGMGEASVGVTVDDDTDWAQLEADGHELSGCAARLYRWRVGDEIERARLVLRGVTNEPAYGAAGEGLDVSVVRSPRTESLYLPPPSAVVDSTTWGAGTPAESAIGQAYPVVIGCPGWDDVAELVRPVVPVPIVEVEVVMSVLVGRVVWIGGDCASATSRLFIGETAVDATGTPAAATDGLGRPVQRLEVEDAGLVDGTAVFVGFDPSTGGGVESEGTRLRGAGDVLAWALSTLYTGPVDWGRVQAARDFLNLYLLDTWINASILAWDWIEAEVLPLLPVELREGREGVYPAIVRYDLGPTDVVRELVAGRDVEREGRITRAGDVVNEVTVEYAPVAESAARWLHRRTLTATSTAGLVDPAPRQIRVVRDWSWDVLTTDERVLGDGRCTESQRRYGVRPLRLQLGAVWDTSTALRIAADVVARQWERRRSVRYVGGTELEQIEVGQAVSITDDEAHLDAVVALVAEVTPIEDGCALDLVLLR